MTSLKSFGAYGALFVVSAVAVFSTLIYVAPLSAGAQAAPAVETTIFLTGNGTWEVPADWNNANNSVHVIGGGAGGKRGASATSGGGGAYSAVTNLSLTPGTSVTYSAGSGGAANSGGDGGDSWFNASSFAACASSATCVKAQGGKGSTGGTSAQGVGVTTTSGGSGGSGGGGGAGTPSGNGANNGGGSTQDLWTESGTDEEAGPGKGGKAGSSGTSSAGSGGAGQSYGGGGGSGGCVTSGGGSCNNTTFGNGGAGAEGIIVIKYLGGLQVSVASEEISCLGGEENFYIYRNGPPNYQAVSGTLTFGGSAVSGVDYEPLSTSFTIPANEFSVEVSVTPLPRNTMGGSKILEISVNESPNFSAGDDAEMEIDNSTLPPIFEELDDYDPAEFTLYPLPDRYYGGRPGALPEETRLAWYEGMPSPGLCNDEESGVCHDKDFDSTQGFRITAITAIPELVQGDLEVGGAGIDLVSHERENECGEEAVRWSYVIPDPTTYFVPKYTPVSVSYACQPNQDFYHQSKTTCFLFIGSCNIADHNHIFRTADRARVEGQNTSALFREQQITFSDGQTFTLQCGGYRPQDGTEANDGNPPALDRTGVDRPGDWFNDADNTYRFYNIPDPTFWHPEISLTVQACSGDDEVVREGACISCATLLPGSYRSGNMCVMEGGPTATLSANGAPDGQTITVDPGEEVEVVGTFAAATGDTLTATAINNDATGVSVPCGQVEPGGSNCWTRPDVTKTYTFTPQESDAGTTFTFSAQIRTTSYPNFNSYKTVRVIVGGDPVCPSDATTNPDGSCTCNAQYYTFVGNSCVLFCPANMQPDGLGSCESTAPPLPTDITFTATRVRSGTPSTLSWSMSGMAAGITCSISPIPTSGQIAWNGSSAWSGTAQTGPITQPVRYTLTCENGVDTPVSRSAVANIIPSFEEI